MGDPEAVSCVLRMPDGRRCSRRFSRSVLLAQVFAFCDRWARADARPTVSAQTDARKDNESD